jgi:hypothetical protein
MLTLPLSCGVHLIPPQPGPRVVGERPASSASNYLLDGGGNDYLVTGLTAIAPEALQEYRISTNNFSAQYGRTTGFVANAVTGTGGTTGTGWCTSWQNEVLVPTIFNVTERGFTGRR